jgi:hypothetical protein
MVRGIVIPAVPFLPVEEREFDGLKDYQDAVGGYIEPVNISEPGLTLYVNEEGKVRKMSLNERATALWWVFSPHARGHDLIVGDAVLTPDGPEDGYPLLQLLQREHGFRVEVQVIEAVGEWLAGTKEFPSWFEAAKFALMLEQRFDFILAVRVTAV